MKTIQWPLKKFDMGIMTDWPQAAQHRSIANKDIEAAEAVMQGGAQLVDQVTLAKIKRYQHGRLAAGVA